ncbi:MAG: hypothetical protein Q9194_002836, partial [Teloschistes cf. exilis]
FPASAAAAAAEEEAGFRLLGAVGNERQTAIFQVNTDDAVADNNGVQDDGDGDGDEMTDAEPTAVLNGQAPASADPIAQFTIGISVEPAPAIEAQLAAVKISSSTPSSSALVRSPPAQQSASQGIPTKVLAQRIIKNAFNFLASFAGDTGAGGGGEEMVPLRSFRGWWEKFERRVEMDPGFLERESDA